MLMLSAMIAVYGCDGSSGYQRNSGTGWHYDDAVFTPHDPATFQPLGKYFGHDSQQGYCRGTAVEGSDGATFEALSDHEARDQHSVYYCDTYRKSQEYWAYQHLRISVIAGADAATYSSLAYGYARDRHRAYDRGEPFAVRDALSFEPLSRRFARDAQRGYFAHVEIPGSHGPSFSLLLEDEGYARDHRQAWHGFIEVNKPNHEPYPVIRSLRGADLNTLRALGRDYAVDAQQVWFQGTPLPQADAASFTVRSVMAGSVDAQDRSNLWQQGRIVSTPSAR
ncbi:hypothetical protein D3C72_1051530 [compost metagenome]